MKWLDAHNHLHDARLDRYRPGIMAELARMPLACAVVNGTREEDWPAVAELARQHAWVIPAFGVHPWYEASRTTRWRERLTQFLDRTPRATLGEIGLDRWIEGYDLPCQQALFAEQLALAAEREMPVTIHCLEAWGAMLEILRKAPKPKCGFLLHAYGGPVEMVKELAGLGAYFSFSPAFLAERKGVQRKAFREMPLERLLVETDAPDMAPPAERNARPLAGGERGLNHPANLDVAYAGLAEVLDIEMEPLAQAVEQNFWRFYGQARAAGR